MMQVWECLVLHYVKDLSLKIVQLISNHAQLTVNGGHGANVVLPVDLEYKTEQLWKKPISVGRSVLGTRLRIVTSNHAPEPGPLTVNGEHGVNVV